MSDTVMEEPHHQVQLFESPDDLARRVAAFATAALLSGGTVAAVARAAHLHGIEREIRASGLSVDAHVASGALQLIDAEHLLSHLMVDGKIDRGRFTQHVGALVGQLIARGGRVHIYGEMVDVLWTARDAEGVLALEALWSELIKAQTADITLLCGYQRAALTEDPQMLERVHQAHDIMYLEQRAVMLELEIERRRRVEHMMTQLLDVTTELAQARSRSDVARAMIDHAPGPLGAFAVAVWKVIGAGKHLELLDASPSERSVAATRYGELTLDGDTPVATAVRTGQSIYLATLEEYALRFPTSRARLEQFRTASHVAFAVVPFATGGAPVGAMVFTFDTPRTFDEAETTYMALVARHCALALTRVQLLDKEREQREAMELLYELIASFNRLDDIDAVYELALASVQRVSRSDRAAILLLDSEGVMRFRASSGLSDRYRAAVEGHSPWAPDALFPAPVVVADAANDPAWAGYRDVFAAEGIGSLAFVPIVHQRKLIGKFMLYRNKACTFAPRDLQLTATVAVHVAQAVERKQQERELARVYREEREAHLLAEDAARSREEILSVVSHDLRNPLGSIMMASSALLGGDAAHNATRVRSMTEQIHRQAERMARLLDSLVDFAGVQTGRVAIERGRHEPRAILATTSEIFGPIASERGLRFETEVLGNLPHIECDSNRAVQVLSNLVSNALKVTPKGGAIAIGAQPKAKDIVFYVRDTGPGIDADELPNMFKRHWRGKQSIYRGTGLGLSIARGIVDAHGGRIWAESQLGVGSTFYFSLTPSS